MENGGSNADQPSSVPIGVRLLVVSVALAGFAYLLYRLIQSWGQWPEDAWTAGFRIAELGFVGVFVLWALAHARGRNSKPREP
jgi:pilus assembly protein TadC